MKISEIYNDFIKTFPKTTLKAFGSLVRQAFPQIEKKNSNSSAYYTNLKKCSNKGWFHTPQVDF